MDLLVGPASEFVKFIPMASILAPFAVKIHRYIILGERLPKKPFLAFFSRRNIIFACYGMLLGLPILLLYTIPTMCYPQLIGTPAWWLSLSPVLVIPYSFILVRVGIFFPFLATDSPKDFSYCWVRTTGNTWRLFISSFAIGVIGQIITSAQTYVVQAYIQRGFIVILMGDVFINIILLLYIAVGVALVSQWLLFFKAGGPNRVQSVRG